MIFKFHHTTFAAFFPTVWKTTSASASAAGAVGNGAGPPAPAATFPRPDEPSDMGVLKKQQRRLYHDVVCPTSCPEDSVAYCYGEHNVTIGPACGEDCCISDDDSACDLFTGCVERDGSCTGRKACYKANVPDGIEKSCMGFQACAFMGGDHGEVGRISNSCNDDNACYDLGYDGGVVGNVSNSCNSKKACFELADYYGYVESITGSCNSDAQQPCRQLYGSNIGSIVPLKRKGRMMKYNTADITMCNEDCDKNVDCSGIKWRQGVQKPCRIFKGGYSGKCGKRDLCID